MIIKLLFVFLLIVMPLLFGGNRWWILNPFEFIISFIFIIKLKDIIKGLKNNPDLKICIIAFAGLGFIILITSILSINPHATLNGISYFMTLFFCFLMAASDIFSRNDRRFFSLIMILSGIVQPFIVIMQLNGFIPHNHWIPDNFVAGSFSNHNHFAGFMAITLLLNLTWLFSLNLKNHFLRIFLIISAIIQFLGIIWSQSRGAWIALMVSIVYISYFELTRKTFLKLVFISSILIVLFAAFVPKGEQYIARFKTLVEINNDISAQSRIDIWKASFNIIKENIFTGTGIGTFRDAIVFFKPKCTNHFINHAHNDYIQWISECGIFSLLFIVFIISLLVLRGLSFSLKSSFFPIACGAIVLLTAVHSFFDYNTRIPAIGFYISVIIGFSYSGKKLQNVKTILP